MRSHFRAYLFASSLTLLPALPFIDAPAQAQGRADISFNGFHAQLRNYGDWLYSDRWGEVWRPDRQDRDPNWRPYSVGHWVYTDEYGWTWASDEAAWSDVVYHYGRWVNDPDAGWLWIAGYVWSPAWVVWRSSGPNVGWMPMPPDRDFLGDPGISINVSFGDWNDINGHYGYSNWYGPSFDDARFGAMWTFVPTAHVADRDYRNYAVARPQVVNFVRDSRNVTNYTVVNNVIINRSVNVTVVQQAAGRPIAPVRAATVFHDTRWIAPVNTGVQVRAQMRQAAPRGNGAADSAPRPTPAQVQTLSARAVPVRNAANGGAPAHIFTRATVAQIQQRPNGNAGPPNPAPPPAAAPQPAPAAAPPAERGGNRGRDNAQPAASPPPAAAPQPAPAAPAERGGNRGPGNTPPAASPPPAAAPQPAPAAPAERGGNRGPGNTPPATSPPPAAASQSAPAAPAERGGNRGRDNAPPAASPPPAAASQPAPAASAERGGNRGRDNAPPAASPPPAAAPQETPAAPAERRGNRGRGNNPAGDAPPTPPAPPQ